MSDERAPWSDAEIAALQAAPWDYDGFIALGYQRTRKAFQVKRETLGITRKSRLVLRDGTEDEPVFWDKKTRTVSWRDFIEPMAAMQQLNAAASRSQDYASISIPAEEPVAVACISDWHIGSWGTDARIISAETDRLLRLHAGGRFYICLVGDMIETAIRLRSVVEQDGNLLTNRQQHDFIDSWWEDLAGMTLWSSWDNHTVERQEELAGVSYYAELMKERTIYHSGIGHLDLTIGDQTYQIASSHHFRGRSAANPVASQMRYLREEAPDREIAIAGDSHRPAVMQYFAGGRDRLAVNCGTLHLNSGYAKRFYALTTSAAMPVLIFHPTEHVFQAVPSLAAYERFFP